VLAGRGPGALVAAYAALHDPAAAAVELDAPPASHMQGDAPAFLGILRVADVPAILGLLAPRPLRLAGADEAAFADTRAIYTAAGAADRLEITPAAGSPVAR
jgi:hypothetical protein